MTKADLADLCVKSIVWIKNLAENEKAGLLKSFALKAELPLISQR